jgi:enolase
MSGTSSITQAIQIRLPNALMDRIEAAAAASALSKNDIIKLALDIGLKILADNGYDLTKGIPSREMEEFYKQKIVEAYDDIVQDLLARTGKPRKK